MQSRTGGDLAARDLGGMSWRGSVNPIASGSPEAWPVD